MPSAMAERIARLEILQALKEQIRQSHRERAMVILPVDLVRGQQVKGDKSLHLDLLEIRVAEEDVPRHAQISGSCEINQMILGIIATPGRLNEMGVFGRNGKDHVENREPFVSGSSRIVEKVLIL